MSFENFNGIIKETVRNSKDTVKNIDINKRLDFNKLTYGGLPRNIDIYKWIGEVGNSLCKTLKEEVNEILKKYGVEGIEYKKGHPDFSKISEADVKIKDFTENREENYKQADSELAKKWNKEKRDGRDNWSDRDIKNYRKEHKLTWHECEDCKTCQLVNTKVHDCFKHDGGIAAYKNEHKIK